MSSLEDRFFVGRAEECRCFGAFLSGATRDWPILNIHGPGGVGKSTLLGAFRRLAQEAGALYVCLDALDLPRSPNQVVTKLASILGITHTERPTMEDCLQALHDAAAGRPVALAFDSYEEISVLDRWLRENFLARLPERAVVVIAGRFPLEGLWRDSPAWRQLVHPLPLAPFDLALTRQYLALHGVEDEPLVRAAWESTRGHPLALSLAASLVRREGPIALAGVAGRPEVVAELTRRWLREVPGERLQVLLEAAATVRRFDQDLMAHLTGTVVTPREFARLTGLSFVRPSPAGWTLHSMVRSVMVNEIRLRTPLRLHTLQQRALGYYAQMLTRSGKTPEWGTALEEFFYLLGDALIRAAFFHADEEEDAGLYVVPASPSDLAELQGYLDEGRQRASSGGPAAFEMVDRDTRSRFSYSYLWVDYIRVPLDFDGLLALGPGVVRIARDSTGRLRGVSVVIPINAATLPYLERQPVTGPYFRRLSPDERAGYAVPATQTSAWFIRHLNSRDLADAAARGALLRDLFQITFRNGRLLTSSPAPFFQELLERCGFAEVPGATHYDFGPDLPSPTYLLDVRGPRLAAYLLHLVRGGAPVPSADTPDSSLSEPLANLLADRLSAWTMEKAPATPVLKPSGRDTLMKNLTPREREVALAVLDGLSNIEIADRLGIELLTVKKHLTRIFAKVNVLSRTQLIKRLLL